MKLPPVKSCINLGFIYNLKKSSDNWGVHYKAGLVYQNHPHVNTASWDEVFYPVVRKDTLCLFFAIVG